MIKRLFKKNSDSEVINYSAERTCFNPAVNLQKHYAEYFEVFKDEDVFFDNLFDFLDSEYDELSSEAWSLPEKLINQFINNERVITTFKNIDSYRLSEFQNRFVSTYKEVKNNQIRNLISNSGLNVTSDDLREGIKTQFFECFNNTILNISRHLDIVINHEIFSIGHIEKILLDLIDETIKPERYSSDSFSINNGSIGNFLDPVHKIAIKHNTFALDDLAVDDKIALIPTLEKHLHNEQNYKIAKGHKYKGIDGLEEFYQLYLNRFQKFEKERFSENEKGKTKTRGYFIIGLKNDSDDDVKNKTLQLNNFLHRIKNRFENDPNDLKLIFKPWNETNKSNKKLLFKGDFKELMRIIGFLINEGIVRRNNTILLRSRFLICGKEITKTNNNIYQHINQVKAEAGQNWYKTLRGYLY